jgi:hypothetical protein
MQTGAPVNVDQAFDAGDIAINTGGSLTGNSNTITVFGNWVTDGTGVFNAGNSHVILKGAVAQSILGSATVTFNNLTIDNDFGTVTSLGQVQTAGLVTLKEGTFQTLGNLRLLSNVTKSSSIGPIQAGADISGDVEIQRFVPAGPATYIYIGAPTVTNPGPHSIENAWDDDITTTGVTGSDFPPPYNFVNIYWYDETVSGSRNNGYTAMTNTANLINPQRGYTIYQSASAKDASVYGNIVRNNTKPGIEQLQALFAEGLWSDSNLALLEFCLKTMTNEAYRVNDDVTNQPDWSHRDKDHCHDKLVGFRDAVRLGVHEYHHELVEK